MKKSIIVFIFIFVSISGYSQKTNFIQIKNVGNSDVPFTTLVITTQKTANFDDGYSFVDILTVDEITFQSLVKFISEYNYKINKKDDYGIYDINIGYANKASILVKKKYNLLTLNKSITFFRDISAYCQLIKLNPKLITSINHIKSEVEYK